MIIFKDIRKTYAIGGVAVNALQGVSLEIKSGEFVAIMGPSGSGKSTLMHVMGLLDVPDSGTYELEGQLINKADPDALASLRSRSIGFVFQSFNLLSRTSALSNVLLPLIYSSRSSENGVHHGEHLLSELGLSKRIHHKPNELSGGEQQRVAIARSLVNRPKIILADEPTGNLDSKTQDEIMQVLSALNNAGFTIVIVTHNEEVADYIPRIIKMRDGVIVSDEKKNAKRTANKFSFAGEAPKQDSPNRFNTSPSFSKEALFFIKQAMVSITAKKVRSLLSVLGILIGVASVISLLALGEGTKAAVKADLESLGSNLLVVRPGSPKLRGVAMDPGSATRFTITDAEAMEKINGVQYVSPSVSGPAQVVYENTNWRTEVRGVAPDYAVIRSAQPVLGRFFTVEENDRRQKLALLGKTVARELFGNANPIGQLIRINRLTFQVIGVLPEKGATQWRDQDDVIVIPIETAMKRLLGTEYVGSIDLQVESREMIEPVKEDIGDLIIRRHRLGDDAEDRYQVRDMTEVQESIAKTTRTLNIFLATIAGIALLVGGIGIMNIMLVSVTERTREIGLRKAVGAREKDIYFQFLIEALILCLIGGVAGTLLGAAITFSIGVALNWSVKITLFSLILAIGFSMLVGVLFGFWPAKQAARLDPILALRYE